MFCAEWLQLIWQYISWYPCFASHFAYMFHLWMTCWTLIRCNPADLQAVKCRSFSNKISEYILAFRMVWSKLNETAHRGITFGQRLLIHSWKKYCECSARKIRAYAWIEWFYFSFLSIFYIDRVCMYLTACKLKRGDLNL